MMLAFQVKIQYLCEAYDLMQKEKSPMTFFVFVHDSYTEPLLVLPMQRTN
jgi:hypothetical protein